MGRTDAEAGSSNILSTWWEEVSHWKRPWCWERLKAGGEGDDRGWDGWMASATRWTWTWANSRSWWWTGRPGMLQSTIEGLNNSNKCFWWTPFNFTQGRMHVPINLISLKTERLNHHNDTEETLDHIFTSLCIRRKSSAPTHTEERITGGHEYQGGGSHRALPEAARRPAFWTDQSTPTGSQRETLSTALGK